SRTSIEAPRRSIEATRRSIEAPRRSVEASRRSIEAPRRSVEAPRRSVEATRRSVEATRRSVEATRRSVEATRRSVEATFGSLVVRDCADLRLGGGLVLAGARGRPADVLVELPRRLQVVGDAGVVRRQRGGQLVDRRRRLLHHVADV